MSASPTGERPCRLCGMPILFRSGPGGKVMPLQRVRKVYTMPVSDRREAAALEIAPDLAVYVSHFETCARASEVRGRRAAQ